MHKVYENDDLMMYFKKRYCHCCGKVLQRKRTERIVRKGDPDHNEYCNIGTKYHPYGDILVIGKEYYCPVCNKTFSCDKQGEIRIAQKIYKRYIVTDEEICAAINQKKIAAHKKILKMRWLLLIPIIGGLICKFEIFSGWLSEKTKSGDYYRLTLTSILLLICISLFVKFIYHFSNIDIADNYKIIILIISSALAFNIPTLWYINHRFKDK